MVDPGEYADSLKLEEECETSKLTAYSKATEKGIIKSPGVFSSIHALILGNL